MSAAGQNLINQIDQYVRNYPVDAFHDLRMNSILKQIVLFIDGATGGGGGTGGTFVVPVTSANFTTDADCPLPALAGKTFELFWDEGQRHLHQDAGEWQYYSGGGFTILLPAFDSSASNYHFVLYIK